VGGLIELAAIEVQHEDTPIGQAFGPPKGVKNLGSTRKERRGAPTEEELALAAGLYLLHLAEERERV